MGLFDSLNASKRTVMEGVETEGMEYVKLRDFIGQKVKTKGFFFTKSGNYGKSVVVVGESVLINMPNWSVSKFETLAADEKMMEGVLSGHLGLDHIAEVPTKKGNTTIGFEFVEI